MENRRIKLNKTSARFKHILKHSRYILSLYFVILLLPSHDIDIYNTIHYLHWERKTPRPQKRVS